MHPGARRQRTLPRACLHLPGGARTPARRLISWGPPAIRPTRAHPQAHCSTEAPANTARRLGRGSMTSPATHFWGEVPPHWAALRWIAAALPTTYAKRPPPRPSLTARPPRRWRWLAPLGMSSLGCRVSRLRPCSPHSKVISYWVDPLPHIANIRYYRDICISITDLRQKWVSPSQPSSGSAATDGDGLSVFGNRAVSSNPLVEISLLVPFPPPSS